MLKVLGRQLVLDPENYFFIRLFNHATFNLKIDKIIYITSQGIIKTNRRIIHPNQYTSSSDTLFSYPKQVFRNYGEISTGQIPLIPNSFNMKKHNLIGNSQNPIAFFHHPF